MKQDAQVSRGIRALQDAHDLAEVKALVIQRAGDFTEADLNYIRYWMGPLGKAILPGVIALRQMRATADQVA